MKLLWASGLIRWEPHRRPDGMTYSLQHLHPRRSKYEMLAKDGLPSVIIDLHISYSVHCFTRDVDWDSDHGLDIYSDNREARCFDMERYVLSHKLPQVIDELPRRHCAFARDRSGMVNYVTVDVQPNVRYAAFFDVMRWRKRGPMALLLTVKSAYPLNPNKPAPGKGKVRFNTLLGHALRGTRPKMPP